jgi:hypothetical protein
MVCSCKMLLAGSCNPVSHASSHTTSFCNPVFAGRVLPGSLAGAAASGDDWAVSQQGGCPEGNTLAVSGF